MNRYRSIIYLAIIILITSCSPPVFQSFYNQEKEDARIAMAFPKYFAMIAIPDDAKEEVKYFTKGMKKIRVLYFEEERKVKPNFSNFASSKSYIPYLVVKKDGSKINVYTQEDDVSIKEIVLDVESDDEGFIVALLGKMDKATFAEALEKAKDN